MPLLTTDFSTSPYHTQWSPTVFTEWPLQCKTALLFSNIGIPYYNKVEQIVIYSCTHSNKLHIEGNEESGTGPKLENSIQCFISDKMVLHIISP